MSDSQNVVRFTAATAYARKIQLSTRVVNLTGGHRGQMAKMDLGYIVIEKAWYPTE